MAAPYSCRTSDHLKGRLPGCRRVFIVAYFLVRGCEKGCTTRRLSKELIVVLFGARWWSTSCCPRFGVIAVRWLWCDIGFDWVALILERFWFRSERFLVLVRWFLFVHWFDQRYSNNQLCFNDSSYKAYICINM